MSPARPYMNKILSRLGLLSVLLYCACGSESLSPEALRGEQLYLKKHADGNAFACVQCHALSEPAEDKLRRPGHPIGNAAYRPSFKNGQLKTLLEAVNTCRVEWMGTTAWTKDTPEWHDLEAFLQAKATDRPPAPPPPALTFEIVAPPTNLSGGDIATGKDLFHQTCVLCHGQNAAGGLPFGAPKLSGTGLMAPEIARRVRTSGGNISRVYTGLTGGSMPFFAKDRLSDDELRHIIAYLLSISTIMPGTGPGTPYDFSVQTAQSSCSKNHPRVGQSAALQPCSHGVTGNVTIVDDCTLKFDNMVYPANGVDVRVYAGKLANSFVNFNPNTGTGKPISTDFHSIPLNNQSFTVRLPSGMTLDDVDQVSIWCVSFTIDFAHSTWGGYKTNLQCTGP